jgi:flagellar basal body-associated protein FliL
MKEAVIVIALIISIITIVAVLGTVLPFLGNNNISQLAYAQTNATSTTNNITMAKSDNITAPIAPQGTSINVSNTTTTP